MRKILKESLLLKKTLSFNIINDMSFDIIKTCMNYWIARENI